MLSLFKVSATVYSMSRVTEPTCSVTLSLYFKFQLMLKSHATSNLPYSFFVIFDLNWKHIRPFVSLLSSFSFPPCFPCS